MVKRRPDLFAAYVGTGQVESWKVSVNSQFDLLLTKARREGDSETIKQLEAIGRPDPTNTDQYFAFTRNFRAAMAPPDRAWLQSLRADAPKLKASNHKDFQDLEDGMLFSGSHVLPDQVREDLAATATRIDTAFFVIQGKDDVITPTQAASDYYDKVEAPVKKLILIPDAGHFAFMTASGAFLAALIDNVRPVAIARGAQPASPTPIVEYAWALVCFAGRPGWGVSARQRWAAYHFRFARHVGIFSANVE